jgi:hypothetical protein
VVKPIINFIKSLCFCNPKRIVEDLFEASSRITYVETVSKSADSLHKGLNDWDIATLQQVYSRICENEIRKLHLGACKAFIDITEEDFYGDTQSFYLVPWTGEAGVKAHFKFIVCCVKYRNRKFPVAVRMIRLGSIISKEIGELLESCKRAGLNIKTIMLDRGFYSADNIRELNEQNLEYIVFAKKCDMFRSMLASTEKSALLDYEMKSRKDKSILRVQTTIALVKNVRRYDWLFATNTSLTGKEIVREYMLRWNIETDFRVQDEARIKTKSTRPEVRLFYFLISCLLLFVWNATQKFVVSFKKFLITLSKTEIVKRRIFFE